MISGEMTHEKASQVYGKERCKTVFNYLKKLNLYYSFPFNDAVQFEFLEDLKNFENSDLLNSLKILEERESDFPLKFNEIKRACKEARSNSKRCQVEVEEEKDRIDMPEGVKIKIDAILKRFTEGDPTKKRDKNE